MVAVSRPKLIERGPQNQGLVVVRLVLAVDTLTLRLSEQLSTVNRPPIGLQHNHDMGMCTVILEEIVALSTLITTSVLNGFLEYQLVI
jgi:hypothetical protein